MKFIKVFAATFALGLAAQVQAIPVADPGDRATVSIGGNFSTDTAGNPVGSVMTLFSGVNTAVGVATGGVEEFEAMNGEIFNLGVLGINPLTLQVGAVNNGNSLSIDFDRTGISDPAGAAGGETGTWLFTITNTIFAGSNLVGQALRGFEMRGFGSFTTPDLPYDSPQPGSFVFNGTIGEQSLLGTWSMTLSSPPERFDVPTPAPLALLALGLIAVTRIGGKRS